MRKLARFRVGYNPYPLHYRTAFAFYALLCPHSQRFALRLTCHEGNCTGLPRSLPITGLG